MRKILNFLSLLLIVNVKYTASAKSTSTNALQLIIEKFESLSRITNGLALQKELNSKSLEIDHLLAEILEINPKNNGFEELRMFKIDDLSKRYAKFSNDAGALKKSEIDEAMVKSQLEVLGFFEYRFLLKIWMFQHSRTFSEDFEISKNQNQNFPHYSNPRIRNSIDFAIFGFEPFEIFDNFQRPRRR
ncbi:hypothetical protein B9Z55_004536 [Caenorhabditis nigoni]|uniref:Domain of unknown function WSN domain-containing protein n=1 Tax=Caenorhabditis nigoni TaxID=1611254 RepID=A0A2G5UWT6_9PELO|nr:hypothetical protein B9Z55_004536 [Caenorhabditis nigoni]